MKRYVAESSTRPVQKAPAATTAIKTAASAANGQSLNEALDAQSPRGRELVAVDDALVELARLDLRKCRVVELRFFGDLSVETAAVFTDLAAECDARLETGESVDGD